MHFNETVFHDLFFAWDETFMLLIDECIRWKTGDQLAPKETKSIVKALINLWIRMFGPMTTLMGDQEGGLVSNLGTQLLDSLNIKRYLTGPGSVTSKGVIEGHIALTKYTMFRCASQAEKEGLDLSHSEICQDACMSQNLLLDFGGTTLKWLSLASNGTGTLSSPKLLTP